MHIFSQKLSFAKRYNSVNLFVSPLALFQIYSLIIFEKLFLTIYIIKLHVLFIRISMNAQKNS